MKFFHKKFFIFLLVFVLAIFLLFLFLSFYTDMKYLKNEESLIGKFDIAVIFFADIDSSGNPNSESYRRFNIAIDMYNKGITRNLLFVGGWRPLKGISGSKIFAQEAVKARIPKENVFHDNFSRDTIQNWVEAEKILKSNNFKNIIIVSDKFHLLRIETLLRDRTMADYQNVVYFYNYENNDVKKSLVQDFFNCGYNFSSFILYMMLPDSWYYSLISWLRV